MPKLPFYLVDVFAATRYEGNPLAVFDNRANQLTDAEMLAIAREINFQETTFIMGGSVADGFRVRIFTPAYEVPFAGHPTLGTAWVLANRLTDSKQTALTLHLTIGPITVNWQETTAWLQTAQPQFGPQFNVADVASLLHLPLEAMSETRPIQWVSTGLPYLIVPLSSIDAIRAVKVDADACEKWLVTHRLHTSNSKDGLNTAFYLFCDKTYQPDNDLNARMFCLENDHIVEDYATGSAASCLLAYLLNQRGVAPQGLYRRVEQGYETGHPSLLELAGRLSDENYYELRIGGQVQFVACGEWGDD